MGWLMEKFNHQPGVFRGLLKCTEMTEELGWLNAKGQLQVSAEITGLPSFAPRVDFSQELLGRPG